MAEPAGVFTSNPVEATGTDMVELSTPSPVRIAPILRIGATLSLCELSDFIQGE